MPFLTRLCDAPTCYQPARVDLRNGDRHIGFYCTLDSNRVRDRLITSGVLPHGIASQAYPAARKPTRADLTPPPDHPSGWRSDQVGGGDSLPYPYQGRSPSPSDLQIGAPVPRVTRLISTQTSSTNSAISREESSR